MRQGAPDVASRSLGKVKACLTVRYILPEASTVRPEPFGSEQFGLELTAERLKAELLTAEGGRRWRSLVPV